MFYEAGNDLNKFVRLVRCTLLNVLEQISISSPVSILQIFDFQHGLLLGEMDRLQVSAVHSMVPPPLELSL